VVKTLLSWLSAWIQSLVREIRSHKLCGMVKKKKKKPKKRKLLYHETYDRYVTHSIMYNGKMNPYDVIPTKEN